MGRRKVSEKIKILYTLRRLIFAWVFFRRCWNFNNIFTVTRVEMLLSSMIIVGKNNFLQNCRRCTNWISVICRIILFKTETVRIRGFIFVDRRIREISRKQIFYWFVKKPRNPQKLIHTRINLHENESPEARKFVWRYARDIELDQRVTKDNPQDKWPN